MFSKRLTDNKPTLALGTFKPTDHVLAAMPDDASAAHAAQALREGGADAADIAQYSATEVHAALAEMSENASEAAGFGYEISLMRRWQELARQGSSMLLVYSPSDEGTARVVEALKAAGARFAVKYHLLAVEDLI